jgi:putative addiction module component (TIGR02574 family)
VSLPEIEEKVAALSKSERLQMMEVLWNAIRKDEPSSPAWHGEILAARVAKAEAGQAEFLTIPELKKRLGR